MKSKIDIPINHLFPFHFIAVGIVFLGVGSFIILMYPLLSIGSLILGIILTTSHYRLTLDTGQKTYREYLWIIGFKKGDKISFQNIEYLYINKSKVKSGYGYVSRINIEDTIYIVFLKLSDAEPVFIGESKNEQKLMKKAEKISKDLNIDVRKNY